MRQLVIILCTIIIQLVGCISAGARMHALAVMSTENGKYLAFSPFFQNEHPADITSSNHFGNGVFKLRYHRTLPALAGWDSDTIRVPALTDRHFNVHASPLFLPLIRSLLYPNHYFW